MTSTLKTLIEAGQSLRHSLGSGAKVVAEQYDAARSAWEQEQAAPRPRGRAVSEVIIIWTDGDCWRMEGFDSSLKLESGEAIDVSGWHIRSDHAQPPAKPVEPKPAFIRHRQNGWQCQKCHGFQDAFANCVCCGASKAYLSGSHSRNTVDPTQPPAGAEPEGEVETPAQLACKLADDLMTFYKLKSERAEAELSSVREDASQWKAVAESLQEQSDKLQAFKDWTHAYLDSKGVPHHPPGPHGAEGCRIGDRMDWVWAEHEAARKDANNRADCFERNTRKMEAELAKLKKLVEKKDDLLEEAATDFDNLADEMDSPCDHARSSSAFWREQAEYYRLATVFAQPQEQPVSKEPAPLDLKVQADAMRGHAWLRRFRQGNNSLSGMACKDIAGYVDRLLDLCGACPWIDPTPEPAPETAAPSFKVGDLVAGQHRNSLHCGSGVYPHAVVASVEPFILVSEEGDMLWAVTIKPEDVHRVGRADAKTIVNALGRLAQHQKASKADLEPLPDAPHPVDEQTNSPEIPDSSTAGLRSHIAAIEAVSKDRLVTIMGLKADLSQTKGYLGIANARIAELEAELAKRAEKPANPFNQGNWPETKTYNVEPNPADVRRSIVTEQPAPNPFNRGDWPEAKTYEVPKPAPTLSDRERQMLETCAATGRGSWMEIEEMDRILAVLSRLALEQA